MNRYVTKHVPRPLRNLLLGSPLPRVLAVVEERTGISEAEIRNGSMQPHILAARQLAVYLAKEVTGLSNKQLGTYFDRDPSAISAARKRVGEELEHDDELAAEVQKLREQIEKAE